MKIDFIGIPLFYGSDRPGVEFGPKDLRENKIKEIFEKYGHEVYDMGDVQVEEVPTTKKYESHSTMKYYSAVMKANEELAEKVHSSIQNGHLPFILGGDHALGMGSVSGAATDNFGVIWIDAHGDINTEESSPSGNMHGMPLASMMGFGNIAMAQIFTKEQKVKSENVFLLGQRDIDQGEMDLIKEKNMNLWTTDKINTEGTDKIADEVIDMIERQNLKNIHISFDIDVLDSLLVPGTGTPVEKGLTVEEVEVLFKKLLSMGKVKSIDFAEFNPIRDTAEKITLQNCLKTIEIIAKYI